MCNDSASQRALHNICFTCRIVSKTCPVFGCTARGADLFGRTLGSCSPAVSGQTGESNGGNLQQPLARAASRSFSRSSKRLRKAAPQLQTRQVPVLQQSTHLSSGCLFSRVHFICWYTRWFRLGADSPSITAFSWRHFESGIAMATPLNLAPRS